MNNQEAFDTMVDHLRQQGERCAVDGECRYRGDGNLKCAIGALIPDELYDHTIEGHIPGRGTIDDLLKRAGVCADLGLLLCMQDVHDDVDNWLYGVPEAEFCRVADRYDLICTRPYVNGEES